MIPLDFLGQSPQQLQSPVMTYQQPPAIGLLRPLQRISGLKRTGTIHPTLQTKLQRADGVLMGCCDGVVFGQALRLRGNTRGPNVCLECVPLIFICPTVT